MVDQEEFERWRSEAGRALESGQLQAGAGLFNWACFAAEQSAQLAVKALLHGLGRGPWGHDLPRLGAEVADAVGKAWPKRVDSILVQLSRHYIPARYPDAHPEGSPGDHYVREDAVAAIAQAAQVLDEVDAIWRGIVGPA